MARPRTGAAIVRRVPGKNAYEKFDHEISVEFLSRKSFFLCCSFVFVRFDWLSSNQGLAESWIRAAAEDHLCVEIAKLAFAKPLETLVSGSGGEHPACGDGKVAAANALTDQDLYDALVDAFSMRGFVPSPGVTAHDHFFDAFGKFGGTDHRHLGEWIDEVATRAAAQNEQYLELMHTPEFGHTAAISKEIVWREDFGPLRDELLAHGLRDDVALAKSGLDQAEALRAKREHCGQADADAACRVQVRFLCQVLRGFPKEQVFAQTLLCFETSRR